METLNSTLQVSQIDALVVPHLPAAEKTVLFGQLQSKGTTISGGK